jgi:tuftelin-interacting protein 11
MGSKLSVVYPDIRRKISQALSGWNPLDGSALTILAPWKKVFDRASMDNLIIRAIVPKLVLALRDLQINPQNQDLSLFQAVLTWHGTVPQLHFTSLFLGEFFPKWIGVLVQWLSVSPDFAEVSQWYVGWKSSFPEELLEEPEFITPFNTALDLMNAALSEINGEELVHLAGASIQESSYIQVLEKKSQETRMRDRLRDLEAPAVPSIVGTSSLSGSAYTFKDVVETFASRNGVEFMPRIGKTHEGKQVWRFGSKSCYLEQDVVFVHIPELHSWRPIGLEELLKLELNSVSSK